MVSNSVFSIFPSFSLFFPQMQQLAKDSCASQRYLSCEYPPFFYFLNIVFSFHTVNCNIKFYFNFLFLCPRGKSKKYTTNYKSSEHYSWQPPVMVASITTLVQLFYPLLSFIPFKSIFNNLLFIPPKILQFQHLLMMENFQNFSLLAAK